MDAIVSIRNILLMVVFGVALPLAASNGIAHPHHHSKTPPLSAEQARKAYQQGHVLSLRKVAAQTLEQFPGKVLKAVLTHNEDEWVYTLVILQEGGYITKVWVDAQDGKLIDHKSRKKRGSRKKHESFGR